MDINITLQIPQLDEMLEHPTKGARLQIPYPLLEQILAFKAAYRERHGRVISRENAIILMMMHGSEGLNTEAELMRDEVKASV